jgi:hypothetical protein
VNVDRWAAGPVGRRSAEHDTIAHDESGAAAVLVPFDTTVATCPLTQWTDRCVSRRALIPGHGIDAGAADVIATAGASTRLTALALRDRLLRALCMNLWIPMGWLRHVGGRRVSDGHDLISLAFAHLTSS